VTITTGAALAPDDDEPADAEDGDTATSLETGTSRATGLSHVFVPHVVGGISLTVAPDVVSDVLPTDGPDVDGDGSLGTARAPGSLDTARAPGSLGTAPGDGAAESLRDHLNDRLAPEIDSPLVSVIALTTTEAPPAPPRAPLSGRLRAALPFIRPGLTGLGGVVLGCLVVGLGAGGDLALGHGLGTGFSATYLLGCVLVACALRTRALAIAVVLPPLLFAGGYALETMTGGQTAGRREMALDVATSLALHAPVLFVGTALAVAIVVFRVVVHLVRR
jgi:hypothetical protein